MGSSGGFRIARVKDRELADVVQLFAAGKGLGAGYSTGIQELWGTCVYIGAYGTNVRGVPFAPLNHNRSKLRKRKTLTIPLIAACLHQDGDEDTVLEGLTWADEYRVRYCKQPSLLDTLKSRGIITGADFVRTWDNAIDWGSMHRFETWT